MGGKVSRNELFKKNFTLREFFRIPIQNYFYLSYFLYADSILPVDMITVIVQGKLSLRCCLEDLSLEGEPDFTELFKKRSETK